MLSFLFTSTPQQEIETILDNLGIYYLFKTIGYPIDKCDALQAIDEYDVDKSKAIIIGDSFNDLVAAQTFNIDFLLRKTDINKSLQKQYNGSQIYNFL